MGCKNCAELPQRSTHTLTVKKPRTTTDADGHIDLTDPANWTTVGQIRGRFITKGGSESFVFKQTKSTTTDVIVAPATEISRQLKDHTDWQIHNGSDVYEITYSDLINKTGREVIIEVKEAT